MGIAARGFTECYLPGLSRSPTDLFSLSWDEDGVLIDISRGRRRGLETCRGAPVIPAMVDQHIHGLGIDHAIEPNGVAAMCASLHNTGVGAFCTSTIALPPEQLIAWLNECYEERTRHAGSGAIWLGVHVEGTFISQEYCGAHDPQFTIGPDLALLQTLLSEPGSELVKMVTLDGDHPNAVAFTEMATRSGIRIALGHTSASFAQAEAIVEAGASCVTHIMNAMRPTTAREPGLLGLALAHPIFMEVIPNPEMVSPMVLEMIVRVATPERLIAVSDALASRTFATSVESSTGLTYIRAARPVGGAVSLPRLVRYLRRPLHGSLDDLVRVTSQNTLTLFGLPASWPPEVGQSLKVVTVDREWHVLPLSEQFAAGANSW